MLSLENISKHFGSLLAIASASSFTLTIFYEYGYFRVVNKNLFHLLNVNDLFKSAIFWLPTTMITITAFALIQILIFEQNKADEDEKREYNIKTSISDVVVMSPFFYYGTIIICFLALFTSYGLPFIFNFHLLLFIIIMKVFAKTYNAMTKFVSWDNRISFVIGIVPILILMSYSAGYTQARQDLNTIENTNYAIFKDGEEQKILRILNESTIVFNEKYQRISVYKNSDVKFIRSGKINYSNRSYLCIWTGYLCPIQAIGSGTDPRRYGPHLP